MIDPENMPERIDQLGNAVTDAWMSKLAEKCQILAYLGILYGKRLAELAAGNRRIALTLIDFELSEIETHPPHNRLGGHLLSQRLTVCIDHLRVSVAENGYSIAERTRQDTLGTIHAITLVTVTIGYRRGQGHSFLLQPRPDAPRMRQIAFDAYVLANLGDFELAQSDRLTH
jgi:hypothetical protein